MKIDSASPSVFVISPQNITYTTTTVWLNYTASDVNLYQCKYNLDNSSNITLSSCSNTTLPAANLTDGTHELVLYVSDRSGNYNTTEVVFKVDTTSPQITPLTANGAWGASSSFVFHYNVTDISGINNCSIFISNSTWNTTQWNSSVVIVNADNNFTVSGLSSNGGENGTYTWHIMCYDTISSSHRSQTASRTLYIGNRSDIMIESITWTTSPSPYKYQNITVNVTINNSGTKNVVNDTYTYVCVSLTSSSNCLNSVRYYPVGSGNLTVGGKYTITINNINLTSDGDYKVYTKADYYNNESNERSDLSGDNNELTKYFSTNLNVIIVSVTYQSGVALAPPSTNITINMSVKYNNGSYVTGLQKSNFTIWDKWVTGGGSYTNRGGYLYFVKEAGNVYMLHYTTPIVSSYLAQYNQHNIIVKASSNINGYSRFGNSSTSSYSLKAPELSAMLDSVASQMTVGNTDKVWLKLKNNGTDAIYNVTVTVATNGSGLKLSKSSCKLGVSWSLPNSSNWTEISGLCDYNNYIEVTANATGTYKLYISSAYGNSSSGQRYNAR